MNGEIDLELYTISIIRLNTAFMKLEDNDDNTFALFNQSANDLEESYQDIVDELNQDEINYNVELRRDNANLSFDIESENKMVDYNSAEISSEKAEDNRFRIVAEGRCQSNSNTRHSTCLADLKAEKFV